MSRRLLEILLLGALLVGGIAEALGDSTLTTAGHVTSVVGATAAVVALTFRRRAPEASFVALFAIVAVWIAIAYGWAPGPFVAFVDILVGAFALGLHGRGRRPLIVFGTVLAILVAHARLCLGTWLHRRRRHGSCVDLPRGRVSPRASWRSGGNGSRTCSPTCAPARPSPTSERGSRASCTT